MDCRTFRKHHFAYLDDTLPGDVMSDAQTHIMTCDACAAHDTLVRRSLMMVRNLPEIQPSDAFCARLQERLAHCKDEGRSDDIMHGDSFLQTDGESRTSRMLRGSRAWFTVAAAITVLGAMTIEAERGADEVMQLAPVMAAAPEAEAEMPLMITPELMQAMATGNPMYSMALLVEEAPVHFLATSSDFYFDDARSYER